MKKKQPTANHGTAFLFWNSSHGWLLGGFLFGAEMLDYTKCQRSLTVGQYLIKITIIINILLQQAKDAQAESPIFSYCGAEKLRESENVHSDTICCIQEQVKHCDDLAPSTANRAQGESFKTISSTLTRFLQKCICLFPFPPVYLQGCLCLCLCISHLFARLCAVE